MYRDHPRSYRTDTHVPVPAVFRSFEVDRHRGRAAGRVRRTIDGPAAAKAPCFGQTAKTRVESAIAGARDFERCCDDMGEFARHLAPYAGASAVEAREVGARLPLTHLSENQVERRLDAVQNRSEERRVGQECVSTCTSGGWPYQ